MKKMLTGLQPTGVITLGNLIGSIDQMVKNQDLYESYIFIADLHAITVYNENLDLNKNTKSLLALYLACGINPDKNTIFVQSQNEYHTYLSWILECNTYFGELSRMHQFKEKSKGKESFTSGLFTYPVLMASDILIYDADIVPVGVDQKQHVEIARDIAIRFNKKYGETFIIPEPVMAGSGAKIYDLQDPSKKMSKSSTNEKGVIRLLDNPEIIRKKIMSATTDSETIVKYDEENKPGISNLITIYSCITNMSIKDVEEKFKDSNYGTFKKEVADVVVKRITDIQNKYNELLNSDTLDKILEKGKEKSREIAKQKVLEVKEKLGFYK